VTFGNAFSAKILHGLRLEGIGKLLAMTSNDQINALACVHFVEVFGRGGVYQLAPDKAQVEGYHEYERPLHLHGRYLFGDACTYQQLDVLLAQRGEIKFTKLTDEFTLKDFRELYGESAIPLFLARPDGSLLVVSEGEVLQGQGSLVSLIPARALKVAEERLSSEREEEGHMEAQRAEAARATRSRAEEYLREEREARGSEPMVATPGAAQEESDEDPGEAAEDEAPQRASGTSPESS